MGASTFTEIGYGMSARETFRELQDDARDEYGHQQGYSGQISDTSLTKDITFKYKQAKNKEKFIDDMLDEVDKRDCWVVELKAPKKNTNKVKSKVIPNPQKGTRKWETRYVIYPRSFRNGDGSFGYGLTQGEAIKKARKYAEENKEEYVIHIEKHLAIGNSKVASVEYKVSTNEAKGKYLFLVCAPE